MKNKPVLGIGILLMLVAIAIFLKGVSLEANPSPIERAIATCTTPDQQPAWMTEKNPYVETSRYLYYEEYSVNGRVEVWRAHIKSAIYTDSDGRVRLKFFSDSVQVELEYFDNWGARWEEPERLSEEEYASYYSMGQAILALRGGDEKWRGEFQVYYTLLFDRSDNQLISVDCPNGARWDLSLLSK